MGIDAWALVGTLTGFCIPPCYDEVWLLVVGFGLKGLGSRAIPVWGVGGLVLIWVRGLRV